MNRLFKILFFAFISFSCFSQNKSLTESCNEVEEKPKDYKFEILGKIYEHKDVVPICLSHLDAPGIEIKIIKETGVFAIKSWENASAISNESAITNKSKFDIKTSKHKTPYLVQTIKAEIVGEKKKLEIKIITIHDVNVNAMSTRSNDDQILFGYDENQILGYPDFSGNKIPNGVKRYGAKFIGKGAEDNIILNARPHEKNISNHVNVFPFPDITFDGDVFPNDKKIKYLLKNIDGGNDFDEGVCNVCDKKIFEIYANTQKTMIVDIYTLRESDDDVINYCESDPSKKVNCIDDIDAEDHKCILPGADGTLDRYLATGFDQFWTDKDNSNDMPLDKIHIPDSDARHTLEIRPSKNILTGKFYCNSVPQPNHNEMDFPTALTESKRLKIEKDLNSIYNQVGISVQVNKLEGQLVNFDIEPGKDDNKLSDAEQFLMQVYLFGGTELEPTIPSNTKLLVIENFP